MARHAETGNPVARRVRLGVIVVVWVAGLLTGLFAILASAVRFGGCGGDGLACRNSGTALAVVVLVGVIAVVTSVTVLTFERTPRRILVTGLVGIVVLAALLVAARELLSTA